MANNNEEWREPDRKGKFTINVTALAPCIEVKGKIGSLEETGKETKGVRISTLSTDLGVNVMSIEAQPGGEREIKKATKRSDRGFSNSH